MDWRGHFSELEVVSPRVSLVVADNVLLAGLGGVFAWELVFTVDGVWQG